MRYLKSMIPLLLLIFLVACSSNENKEKFINNKTYDEKPKVENFATEVNEAKEENKEIMSKESTYEDESIINKIVLEEQARLQYDESVAIEYKGKKLIITGNKEFKDIDEFQVYYNDIVIPEEILDFKFDSLKIIEKQNKDWYFTDEKILSDGELNRIFKREISHDNVNMIKINYGNLKGTISMSIFRKDDKLNSELIKHYDKIVKRENKKGIYYIFEDDFELFKGIYFEEKRENGYKSYIDLEYYNDSQWNIDKALKLQKALEDLFKNLKL
ncbi:hypothetical protein [Oceanirhabdus sp. W0125-5]|uniref:hypothetical protein n=1 Tax=Oceanirhabdus sp. W0125-5 TaxID=2999116 RepID=UPI0022F2FBCE|nr:hypothetical protein [Oceanirhabdus sp. W0125-5]WBW97363.1 hypothetical protein OW730_00480 [Oceanirhabdus sp. W0125-5]